MAQMYVKNKQLATYGRDIWEPGMQRNGKYT